jgi:hypothetical protein
MTRRRKCSPLLTKATWSSHDRERVDKALAAADQAAARDRQTLTLGHSVIVDTSAGGNWRGKHLLVVKITSPATTRPAAPAAQFRAVRHAASQSSREF